MGAHLAVGAVAAVAQRRATARCLLQPGAGPTGRMRAALVRAGPERGYPLLGEALALRLPLSASEWERVPFLTPGLGAALAAVLAHSPEQARQLVRRLPRADLLRPASTARRQRCQQRRCCPGPPLSRLPPSRAARRSRR